MPAHASSNTQQYHTCKHPIVNQPHPTPPSTTQHRHKIRIGRVRSPPLTPGTSQCPPRTPHPAAIARVGMYVHSGTKAPCSARPVLHPPPQSQGWACTFTAEPKGKTQSNVQGWHGCVAHLLEWQRMRPHSLKWHRCDHNWSRRTVCRRPGNRRAVCIAPQMFRRFKTCQLAATRLLRERSPRAFNSKCTTILTPRARTPSHHVNEHPHATYEHPLTHAHSRKHTRTHAHTRTHTHT
jgi:hypothetical protein